MTFFLFFFILVHVFFVFFVFFFTINCHFRGKSAICTYLFESPEAPLQRAAGRRAPTREGVTGVGARRREAGGPEGPPVGRWAPSATSNTYSPAAT